MATSGSFDYTITAVDLIRNALNMVGAISAYQAPTALDMQDAYTALNLMLKGWETNGPNIFRWTEASTAVVASSPTQALNADVVRIQNIRYKNPSGIETRMFEMSREEYDNLPNKLSTGIPTNWFFDYSNQTPLLYMWPILTTVTTDTFEYAYQRRTEDIDDPSNEIDVAQEWLETVQYNLASRLADAYGKTGPRIDRVIARAEMLHDQAIKHGHDGYVQFVVSRYGYGSG